MHYVGRRYEVLRIHKAVPGRAVGLSSGGGRGGTSPQAHSSPSTGRRGWPDTQEQGGVDARAPMASRLHLRSQACL